MGEPFRLMSTATWGRGFLLCALIIALAACGSRGGERDELDYGGGREEVQLEVPPDLDLWTGEGRYTVPRVGEPQDPRRSAILPEVEGVRFVRAGPEFWLEVERPPEELWPHLEGFWEDQGFELTRSDPRHGVIETDWRESLGDKPDGLLRRALGVVGDRVYSAGLRDQYRLRLERGERAEQTRIFIVHRARERVPDGEAMRWVSRQPEPDRAAEMQRRLLVHLGADWADAERIVSTDLDLPAENGQLEVDRDAEGQPILLLDSGFARSWRMVGRALEQRGFRVEDRNRSEGVYYIRYLDPDREADNRGFFQRMAFWRDSEAVPTEYQIRLDEVDRETAVAVFNERGERDASGTAARILGLIREQLSP